MTPNRTIHIVDPDRDNRVRLARLLRNRGMTTQAFACGTDILEALSYLRAGLVLIASELPDQIGLSLLTHLRERRPEMVFIVMSNHPTIAIVVQALHLGAADFLELPSDEETLLAMVDQAFLALPSKMKHQQRLNDAHALFMGLTPREHQVLHAIVDGQTSRRIAESLNISIRTVEMHRSNVMQKLNVDNLASLIRLAIFADTSKGEVDVA